MRAPLHACSVIMLFHFECKQGYRNICSWKYLFRKSAVVFLTCSLWGKCTHFRVRRYQKPRKAGYGSVCVGSDCLCSLVSMHNHLFTFRSSVLETNVGVRSFHKNTTAELNCPANLNYLFATVTTAIKLRHKSG
jgi:hypothetical protein